MSRRTIDGDKLADQVLEAAGPNPDPQTLRLLLGNALVFAYTHGEVNGAKGAFENLVDLMAGMLSDLKRGEKEARAALESYEEIGLRLLQDERLQVPYKDVPEEDEGEQAS